MSEMSGQNTNSSLTSHVRKTAGSDLLVFNSTLFCSSSIISLVSSSLIGQMDQRGGYVSVIGHEVRVIIGWIQKWPRLLFMLWRWNILNFFKFYSFWINEPHNYRVPAKLDLLKTKYECLRLHREFRWPTMETHGLLITFIYGYEHVVDVRLGIWQSVEHYLYKLHKHRSRRLRNKLHIPELM